VPRDFSHDKSIETPVHRPGKRARFFVSLAAIRIAPDTHLVQAVTDALVSRRGGFATPEERWYRAVSEGFAQTRGCRKIDAIPWLARDAGDADSMNRR
jgi:hypothetical protein